MDYDCVFLASLVSSVSNHDMSIIRCATAFVVQLYIAKMFVARYLALLEDERGCEEPGQMICV